MADVAPIKAAEAEVLKLAPIEAPIIHASQAFLTVTGGEVSLILARSRPTGAGDQVVTPYAKVEPVAIIVLSPQTAKDLSIILSEQMEKFEADYGKMNTPFVQTRQKSAG